MDYSIVGCDPGLDMFGLSAIGWNSDRRKLKFLKAERVVSPTIDSTETRVLQISRAIGNVTASLPGKLIYVVEKPVEALYGRNQARVAGVLKLFSVIYGVLGALLERGEMVYTIYPHEWQPAKQELERRCLKIKKWSRISADGRLLSMNVKRKNFTIREQDIADAVNICFYGAAKVSTGAWAL